MQGGWGAGGLGGRGGGGVSEAKLNDFVWKICWVSTFDLTLFCINECKILEM